MADVLEPFVRYLRFQRSRQGAPSSPPRPDVHHQVMRPPLRGGGWWCVDLGSATCKTLETAVAHRSTDQSLAQSFLGLTFRIFLRVLKAGFVGFVKTVEEVKLAECTKGFRQIMRTDTVNYYGGCFQYNGSTKARVVWVPQLLRKLVFWRWPTEVRWGLLKSFNPGFDFAGIESLNPGGNYASSAERGRGHRAPRGGKVREQRSVRAAAGTGRSETPRPGGAHIHHREEAAWRRPCEALDDRGPEGKRSKQPAHFPTKEFVMEKILLQDRPLFESDVMDCFHLLPMDKAWRWLVCIYCTAHGSLQYTKLSMGHHTNSVSYCFFVVYWFHAHLRRKGLIKRGRALNVPGAHNFNPASSSILYEDTCAEQYMDDMIGAGPPDLQHASNEARAVGTEGNRLGLVQHPAKHKQPTVSKAQNDEPADERQYGGFKLATSPLARVGVDSTFKSARVMAGVLMSVGSLSRRTQLGFYGKLVFLEQTL
jgi:hypothetical protein